ncbi:MAG: hypothetical protein NTW21_39875 [Verrucomicrobia bacterium]|nr:hypothetical protein [Verrucomicrobiota bacterium]
MIRPGAAVPRRFRSVPATALQGECLGAFSKNKAQAKRTATAKDALRLLWDYGV